MRTRQGAYRGVRSALTIPAGLVWDCTDIPPGEYVHVLADLGFKRRTYAAAARAMRKYLAE